MATCQLAASPVVVTSAAGKVILFGEHAVVHGHKAIACAVGKRTFAAASTSDSRHCQLPPSSASSSTLDASVVPYPDSLFVADSWAWPHQQGDCHGCIVFRRPDIGGKRAQVWWQRDQLLSQIDRFVALVACHALNLATDRSVDGSTANCVIDLLRDAAASAQTYPATADDDDDDDDDDDEDDDDDDDIRHDKGVLAFVFLVYMTLMQWQFEPNTCFAYKSAASHNASTNKTNAPSSIDSHSIKERLPRFMIVSTASQIPVGVGLGSSAAFSCSLVGCLYHALWKPHCGDAAMAHDTWLNTMNLLSHQVEFLMHGPGASGVDNSVATYGTTRL
jgi:hypothetical protein